MVKNLNQEMTEYVVRAALKVTCKERKKVFVPFNLFMMYKEVLKFLTCVALEIWVLCSLED